MKRAKVLTQSGKKRSGIRKPERKCAARKTARVIPVAFGNQKAGRLARKRQEKLTHQASKSARHNCPQCSSEVG